VTSILRQFLGDLTNTLASNVARAATRPPTRHCLPAMLPPLMLPVSIASYQRDIVLGSIVICEHQHAVPPVVLSSRTTRCSDCRRYRSHASIGDLINESGHRASASLRDSSSVRYRSITSDSRFRRCRSNRRKIRIAQFDRFVRQRMRRRSLTGSGEPCLTVVPHVGRRSAL